MSIRAAQGVGDSGGLLEDFLLHEGVEATLLGRLRVPVNVIRLARDHGAVGIGDDHRVGRNFYDLVLTEFQGLARVLDEGDDVGGEEVLAFAKPNDERAVAASANDHLGFTGVHRQQGEGAVKAPDDGAHCLGERLAAVHLARQQVTGDLGVRLGLEDEALRRELRAQGGEVLDDAVVDDRDATARREVRVRVRVRGRAVSGPPGVANGGGAVVERVFREFLGEVDELARALGDVEPFPVFRDDRDACGVVAAVFEPREAAHHHALGPSAGLA